MLPLYLCRVDDLPRFKMVPFQIGHYTIILNYSENRIYAFNRFEEFLTQPLDESGVVCKDVFFTSETYTWYCLRTGKPIDGDTPPLTLYTIDVYNDHIFAWVPDDYDTTKSNPG